MLNLWRNRGIAFRLLAIAVLPAALMFLVVSFALYASTQSDVRRDVSERGQLIASALAQSSPYGLVSGNLGYVHSTMHQLLASDASIASIRLIDDQGRILATHTQPVQHSDQHDFDAPVRIESMGEADLLDPVGSMDTPHLRTLGLVRVTMSATPVFQARKGAMLLGMAMVLIAAVASCLLGLRLTRRLRKTMSAVMAALRAIRKGDFDVQLDTHEPDELGELQRTILQMAAALVTARQDLEQQVRSRTQELRVAVDQLRQTDAEKRRLISHSNALIESDRKRVAVEIHDHLGASLISVRLEASAMAARAKALGDEDLARSAQRMAQTVHALYTSTRDIVKSLRPEVLDTLGLAGAVEELVSGYDRVHPHCRFSLDLPEPLPPVCSELAMQAYRVIQESLTNVIKHAGATRARVRLGVHAQGDQLAIEIHDNGNGFDTGSRDGNGLGLIGMRERVASVGGEICISSPQRQGTTITVTLPLAHKP
jgi:two-component system sensor histidine kinase UhpB